MTETWRLIDFGVLDPYEHFPTQEAIITSVGKGLSPNTLSFAQVTKHVVTSQGTNMSERVRFDYCKDNDIPVIRSFYPNADHNSSYHNIDFLQCVLFVNAEEPHPLYDQWINNYILVALGSIGFQITLPAKTNNLLINGMKTGVAALVPFGKTLVFGSSFYVVSTIDEAEKTIISPRDMRSTCTALSTERGEVVSVDEIKGAILQRVNQIPDLVFKRGVLNSEEEVLREKLKEKYASEMWQRSGRWSPVKDYWRPQ